MCNEKLWSKLKLKNYETLTIPKEDSFEKMIEKLDIQISKHENKINLIGFSMGGYLALKYMIANPHKINKALIIASGMNQLNDNEVQARIKALDLLKRYKEYSLSNSIIKDLLENKDNITNINLIQDMFKDLGLETYKQQLQATLERKCLYDDLKSINVPTLFFYSNKDKLVKKDLINRLCEEKKSFDNVVINSCSHMLTLEYEEELANIIKKFFTTEN